MTEKNDYPVTIQKLVKKHKKPYLITPTGITLNTLYITGLIYLLIYFNSQLRKVYDLEFTYKEHTPIIKLDSIKYSSPIIHFDESKGEIILEGLLYWVKLKNYSNEVCNILVDFSFDTLSYRRIIRNKIISQDTSRFTMIDDNLFKEYILYPNESKWYKIQSTINTDSNFSNKKSFLHILFIYTNPIGGYYDLYVIQEYEFIYDFNKPIQPSIDTIKHNISYRLPSMIRFTDNRKSFEPYCYTLSEMEFLDNLYDSHFEKDKSMYKK